MPSSTPVSPTYRIQPAETVELSALCRLYDAVGWSSYTQETARLLSAINGSDFLVVAHEQDELVGLIRVISDDASIVYVQDILVHPTHQGQGVGRALMEAVLNRYEHVRQKVLLTDNRPEQKHFYESMGFRNTRELTKTPLNAFVIIEGVELG